MDDFFEKCGKIFKIFVIILVIAQIIAFSISCIKTSNSSHERPNFIEMLCENEHYIYYYNDEKEQIHILGLTDKGKEQEYLIIPEKIDGKTVGEIGCNNNLEINDIAEKYGDKKYAQIRSENLKKIFLTSGVKIVNGWFTGGAIQSIKYEGTMFILNTSSWSGEKAYKSSYATTSISIRANVSYFYNYDNAPNDNYYWIDNYDYGKKIEFIPPKPTREGYIFDGWYKESECINKWDFEVDVLPEVKYTDVIPTHQLRNDETRDTDFRVYQETKLYAKWIEQGG